jgi:hypothetical protein
MRLPRLKTEWLSAVELATWGMFMVLCFVSMNNSRLHIICSKQRRELSQLGPATIAPDNLTGALGTFHARVQVQDRSFPIETLTELPAWTELKGKLEAYTERLKLLQAHDEKVEDYLLHRSEWTSHAMLGAILANLAAAILKRRNARQPSNGMP